jgi:hypothetical protein
MHAPALVAILRDALKRALLRMRFAWVAPQMDVEKLLPKKKKDQLSLAQ